jgi:hypothetical protein
VHEGANGVKELECLYPRLEATSNPSLSVLASSNPARYPNYKEKEDGYPLISYYLS